MCRYDTIPAPFCGNNVAIIPQRSSREPPRPHVSKSGPRPSRCIRRRRFQSNSLHPVGCTFFFPTRGAAIGHRGQHTCPRATLFPSQRHVHPCYRTPSDSLAPTPTTRPLHHRRRIRRSRQACHQLSWTVSANVQPVLSQAGQASPVRSAVRASLSRPIPARLPVHAPIAISQTAMCRSPHH